MATPSQLPPRISQTPPPPPTSDPISQNLLRHGVFPTPKILHRIRKKEAQKAARRERKRHQQNPPEPPPLSEEERRFETIKLEYRELRRPWERAKSVGLGGGREGEGLVELREMFEGRKRDVRWLLDGDVEEVEGGGSGGGGWRKRMMEWKERTGDKEKITWLVQRLHGMNLSIQDWKFPRLMKQSGLYFAENSLLKILEELGKLDNWEQALNVVQWVYGEKEYRHCESRFVYTKLLAVLGKAKRANEALRIFNIMLGDCQIYPDMAAYHNIAVTLGQAGFVKELINIIDCMKQKPSKKLKNMRRKNWDPCLDPDVIIYNAVINACVPAHHWKGVFWVLQQMRHGGVKPNGATYGLAMEVMLEAGKYDFVHKLFGTMQRSGLALKAITYKVIVKTFWREGRIHEAVVAVRDMEQRGIVGIASVYYELARCLCNCGMWKDALLEVEKLKKLPLSKPLEVAFTGMIQSAMDGGHLHDCASIFKHMKGHCVPNIGTINVMLKVYSRQDMFAKAKQLFEAAKAYNSDVKHSSDALEFLTPDLHTYTIMLEASAASHQWEYFEHLYKEMVVSGYKLEKGKSAHLLVEASKAGKCHLLEHAFDTILEAGEIPHVLLFTERLRQIVAHQNYDKVVPLINGMALASLHVSERQWIKLFDPNMDDIDADKIQALLDILNENDVIMEDPVPSLIKALQHFCCPQRKLIGGSITPVDALNDKLMLADPEVKVNELNEGLQGVTLTVPNNFPENKFPGEDIIPVDDNQLDTTLMTEDSCNAHSKEESIHAGSHGCFASTIDYLGSDYAQNRSPETSTEETINLLISNTGSSYPKLPTAGDILEEWKQKMMEDNIFPFQL